MFIDESGFYLLPAIVRTYAPCGETPILRVFQTYDHLSMMSGITPASQLYTLTRDEALTGVESVQFLKQVRHQVGTDLLAVWDGSPIHRGAEVKAFLAEGGAPSIHLERLPGYAPDLNPDEGVWDLLKEQIQQLRSNLAANFAKDYFIHQRLLCRLFRAEVFFQHGDQSIEMHRFH